MRKQIDQSTRAYIYSRDEGVCQHCGCKVASNNFHIDHIKAVAKGGVNHLDNYALSCPRCNVRKKHHDLPFEKFKQLSEVVKERNFKRVQLPMTLLIDKRKRFFNAKTHRKERTILTNTFGERIKHFASEKFDSQTGLAQKLGMSVQTLSGYANGRNFPSEDFFLAVSKLGCNVHWLLTGEGEMLHKPDENAAKIAAIRAIVNSETTGG